MEMIGSMVIAEKRPGCVPRDTVSLDLHRGARGLQTLACFSTRMTASVAPPCDPHGSHHPGLARHVGPRRRRGWRSGAAGRSARTQASDQHQGAFEELHPRRRSARAAWHARDEDRAAGHRAPSREGAHAPRGLPHDAQALHDAHPDGCLGRDGSTARDRSDPGSRAGHGNRRRGLHRAPADSPALAARNGAREHEPARGAREPSPNGCNGLDDAELRDAVRAGATERDGARRRARLDSNQGPSD